MSESYSGGTPSVGVKEYYGGQIPFIRSAEINSEITELFLTEEGLKNSSARLVAVGDILYALYGATSGEVGRARLKGAINQAILAIKPHTDYDSEYLAQWLRKSKHSIIETYLQGGQGNLSGTIVKELSVDFPSLKEQKAIGDFFRQLDNLITLHQRQHFLHSTPDISLSVRLIHPFYTSSWEQRKVSDLAEKTYGGGTPTTSNEAYWNGDIPWIQSSDVVDGKLLGVEPRKWITQDGLNNSAAQLIPGNSIAIITRVGVGKLAFMPYSYATSQDFLSLSKLNAEPLFTVYACYKKLQSELNAVQGTSIKGITKDELLAKNIMVPRYAEQQQIGAFFKQLDNLITLHQRKGKAAVSGCSNDANNSKGVCCKARDFGYKCHKKDEPNRFDA